MFGLMWVIDQSGKDFLITLPKKEDDDEELDEFFQKINSAAGIKEPS
jgi:hypothetical protein